MDETVTKQALSGPLLERVFGLRAHVVPVDLRKPRRHDAGDIQKRRRGGVSRHIAGGCCASAVTGRVAATPVRTVTKSRHLMTALAV